MKMYLQPFCKLLAKPYYRQKFLSPFFFTIGFYSNTKKRDKTWVIGMWIFNHGANIIK